MSMNLNLCLLLALCCGMALAKDDAESLTFQSDQDSIEQQDTVDDYMSDPSSEPERFNAIDDLSHASDARYSPSRYYYPDYPYYPYYHYAGAPKSAPPGDLTQPQILAPIPPPPPPPPPFQIDDTGFQAAGFLARRSPFGYPHQGYPHPGYPHHGYPHPSDPHHGYPHPGDPHHGYPHPSDPHHGYPHPGYPHHGYPHPGYPSHDYPHHKPTPRPTKKTTTTENPKICKKVIPFGIVCF